MANSLLKNLEELVQDEVITSETADKITKWYADQHPPREARLLAIFGVIGAILIGLGLILIVAHNWDAFPRGVKTVWAFVPLILGLAGSAYTLLKRPESVAMRESSGSFTILAVGVAISLVSQIYNIEGDLAGFLLTWCLIALPLVYALKSNVGALLYIAGITWYGGEVAYDYPSRIPWLYLPLLCGIIPYYINEVLHRSKENGTTFLHWFVVASAVYMLPGFHGEFELLPLAYAALFGVLWQIGALPAMHKLYLVRNPYRIVGALGTTVMLIICSFKAIWSREMFEALSDYSVISALVLLVGMAGIVLYRRQKGEEIQSDPMTWIPPALVLMLPLSAVSDVVSAIVVNLITVGWGIYMILHGTARNHLGWLNFGLVTIAVLIVARFFDMNISYVLRGLLFVGVGVAFLLFNYRLIQQRKKQSS
ncbi:MAG: DUF2157 domain-containing protein [Flavobacteriales bacterium]|nr:DUF2157 domain-containing protein [Flavobacteriales bacterium]